MNTYILAEDGQGEVDGELPDGTPAESLALALSRKQAQFAAFFLAETVAVAHLGVVRGQLMKQLANAVLLAHTVHVRHLILCQCREVQVNLGSEATDNKVSVRSSAFTPAS